MYAVDLCSGAVDEELLDRPGVPPEPVFLFEEEPEPQTQPSDCFGPQCAEPPPPCDGDDCPQQSPPGRDIGCLVGPERCNAGQTEVPVRTFWTQVTGSE
jgi:hypothetical protein